MPRHLRHQGLRHQRVRLFLVSQIEDQKIFEKAEFPVFSANGTRTGSSLRRPVPPSAKTNCRRFPSESAWCFSTKLGFCWDFAAAQRLQLIRSSSQPLAHRQGLGVGGCFDLQPGSAPANSAIGRPLDLQVGVWVLYACCLSPWPTTTNEAHRRERHLWMSLYYPLGLPVYPALALYMHVPAAATRGMQGGCQQQHFNNLRLY